MRVGGNRQNMMATPRTICGQNISSKSAVRGWKALRPSPTANKAKPQPVSTRAPIRLSRIAAMGAATSWATPVTSMMVPISNASWRRTKARKTGIR